LTVPLIWLRALIFMFVSFRLQAGLPGLVTFVWGVPPSARPSGSSPDTDKYAHGFKWCMQDGALFTTLITVRHCTKRYIILYEVLFLIENLVEHNYTSISIN